MPRKQRSQRKQRPRQRKRAAAPRPAPSVRPAHNRASNAPKAHGENKLRTTQVSNLHTQRLRPMDSVKDSQMAAVGVLDPFAAFARQYKTGLPFAPFSPPVFGFWTRTIKRAVELNWTGVANTCGINVTIFPWANPQYQEANVIDSLGRAASVLSANDPQLAFMTTNFDNLTVAFQGVRVRNLTPVLNQGGELVIGITSYEQYLASGFNDARSSSTTMTHANGDPGVIAQCAWVGNPANGDSWNVGSNPGVAVSDYRFAEPTSNALDPEIRVMNIRTFNASGVAAPVPQAYEIEIVTYYVAIPLAIPSQIFAPVRYDVDHTIVTRLMDEAYNKSPQFSIARNFVKDDMWDDMWTGVKDIVKDIGLGIIGTAASAVGTAFSGLFAGKRKNHAFLRMLTLLPPDSYVEFKKLLTECADHAAAMAAVQRALVPRSTLTSADLERIAEALGLQDEPAVVVGDPAAAAAAATPQPQVIRGWFGRK